MEIQHTNLSKADLWKTYDAIGQWIRFSDTKAGALVAVNGVIISLMISNIDQIMMLTVSNNIFYGLILFLGFFSAACVCTALVSLLPTLNIGEPESLIFFAHIAKKYKNYSEYENDLYKKFSTDEQIARQIAHQILANSKVATKKFRRVTWAMRFFACEISIILFCVVSVFYEAYV